VGREPDLPQVRLAAHGRFSATGPSLVCDGLVRLCLKSIADSSEIDYAPAEGVSRARTDACRRRVTLDEENAV